MESEVFTNLSGLNKQYEIVRDDILKRHGYEKGAKVRLNNAIKLYQKFNGVWLPTSSTKTAMRDRIKMNEVANKDAEYKLVAMV